MKIAIVGSGISGLAVAHRLHGLADITLLEAGDYFGGHTHTVDVTLPGPSGPTTHGVWDAPSRDAALAMVADLDCTMLRMSSSKWARASVEAAAEWLPPWRVAVQ